MSAPQFVQGSSHTITTSNPADANGNPDPFVAGDTVSYEVLNADDSTPATDQGTIGAPALSSAGLSYTAPFTVPNAIGDYFLRTTLTNADGTPAKVADFEFGVVAPDISTATTAIA